MPQPTIAVSGGFAVCKFGNLALPDGQGTLAWQNLNDGVSWFLQDWNSDEDMRQLVSAQNIYLATGAWLSDDFGPRKISLPMRYVDSGTVLGAALATLMQAGEQYLTFDTQTALYAKVAGFKARKQIRKFGNWMWEGTLDFLCRDPFFYDLTATTPAGSPWAIAGSAAGAQTTFSITYGGSVFTRPTFTLTIPGGNGAAISSFVLQNTMKSQAITIVFPGTLAASTAYTITINTATQRVTDANGTIYDLTGSFPMLYPEFGGSQHNTWTATLTTVSGATTGVTLGASYSNRWQTL